MVRDGVFLAWVREVAPGEVAPITQAEADRLGLLPASETTAALLRLLDRAVNLISYAPGGYPHVRELSDEMRKFGWKPDSERRP